MGLKTETPKFPLENLPKNMSHGVGGQRYVFCQGVGKPLLAQHPETSVALYWPKTEKTLHGPQRRVWNVPGQVYVYNISSSTKKTQNLRVLEFLDGMYRNYIRWTYKLFHLICSQEFRWILHLGLGSSHRYHKAQVNAKPRRCVMSNHMMFDEPRGLRFLKRPWIHANTQVASFNNFHISTYSFLITHTSQVQVTLLTILWLGAISIERGVTKSWYDTDISKLILSFPRSRHRCSWIFHGTVDGSRLWIFTKINPIYTLYIRITIYKYLYTLHSSWTFALDFWTMYPTHSKIFRTNEVFRFCSRTQISNLHHVWELGSWMLNSDEFPIQKHLLS